MRPREFVVTPEPRSHFVLLEKVNNSLGCCQFRQSSDNLLTVLWFLSHWELSVVLKIPVCVLSLHPQFFRPLICECP